MSLAVLIESIITIFLMIFLCYFTSGISNVPGSIFEKKTAVEKNSKK